ISARAQLANTPMLVNLFFMKYENRIKDIGYSKEKISGGLCDMKGRVTTEARPRRSTCALLMPQSRQ
ncbi:MAG: hypothetical protein J5972_00005, partial [Eubacterium sp.]|nr:hypothetical protein [Eubacterium sp.]